MKNINLKDLIVDVKVKESNFEEIHNMYKDSSEVSFIDSLEMEFDNLKLKEYFEGPESDFELIMIHRESRKIYYLFLHDNTDGSNVLIMKNNSIMKNKVYSLKLSQFVDREIKITYVKNDRKTQSKEIFHHSDKKHEKTIQKYSMI